jgi:beta-lactam-binding protein with PASTA domain
MAEQAGIEVEPSGSGVALEQSPPAGARIVPGQKVTVRFGR